jgi:hypothetical protein
VAAIVGSQSSPLSWELRAPPPPGVTPWRPSSGGSNTVVVLLLVAILAVLLFPLVLILLAMAAVAALILLIPIVIALAIVAIVQLAAGPMRAERRREATQRYNHALTYWNQLLYCYRCHGVFLPANPWQYVEVTREHAVAPPYHAWVMAQQLADYAERAHAPQIVRADDL